MKLTLIEILVALAIAGLFLVPTAPKIISFANETKAVRVEHTHISTRWIKTNVPLKLVEKERPEMKQWVELKLSQGYSPDDTVLLPVAMTVETKCNNEWCKGIK